jgi:hypothetical protein
MKARRLLIESGATPRRLSLGRGSCGQRDVYNFRALTDDL